MKSKTMANSIDLERKVFDIKNEPMPRGAWWWWFWLFFFKNPKNPEKPRQVMIIWSTKNEKEIDCNNLKFKFNRHGDRSIIDGIVAAWYFDGETMHPLLLEQCGLNISEKELITDSTLPTSFFINKTKSTVNIGDDFKFIAETGKKHDFMMPTYFTGNYFGNWDYSMIRVNHLDLSGKIKNEPIHGSALFHRVFLNTPVIPWYWGLFHFENGGVMNYSRYHLLGKSSKECMSFYDGKEMHEFDYIDIKRSGGNIPTFIASAENEHEKINFTVDSHSHFPYIIRKKTLGTIPNKLTYNEYPAVISDLKLTNKKTGKTTTLKYLGRSVGNAEHTTGFLL